MKTQSPPDQIMRTTLVVIIISCVAAFIFTNYSLIRTFKALDSSIENRYTLLSIADELGQSSDDLTRLARTFAVTQNNRFEKQFYKVLAIRNGTTAKPYRYNSLYWNLAATQDEIPVTRGEKKPLIERLQEQGIQKNELDLLLKSMIASDSLSKLEEIAFRASKNTLRPEDEAYRIPGESNRDMAMRVLNSDQYHLQKVHIMMPIQEFLTAIEQRTSAKNKQLTNKTQFLMIIQLLLATLILLLILVLYNSDIVQQRRSNATMYSKITKTEEELETITKISETDGLTQIPNRRFLDQKLEEEWNRCKRTESPLSVILFDIDYFKEYNDIAGHLAGDAGLQKVSALLAACVQRSGEFVARYGGEEFMMVLPNTTTENAVSVAEKARILIMSAKLHSNGTKNITISAGVASQIPRDDSSLEVLIDRADQALYAAKSNGRNRVEKSNSKKGKEKVVNIV